MKCIIRVEILILITEIIALGNESLTTCIFKWFKYKRKQKSWRKEEEKKKSWIIIHHHCHLLRSRVEIIKRIIDRSSSTKTSHSTQSFLFSIILALDFFWDSFTLPNLFSDLRQSIRFTLTDRCREIQLLQVSGGFQVSFPIIPSFEHFHISLVNLRSEELKYPIS